LLAVSGGFVGLAAERSKKQKGFSFFRFLDMDCLLSTVLAL
jgi:hypothetical protein